MQEGEESLPAQFKKLQQGPQTPFTLSAEKGGENTQSPKQLAAAFLQSSIVPRNESYQILMGQNRNGPQEKSLFLCSGETKTFNQLLIRGCIL